MHPFSRVILSAALGFAVTGQAALAQTAVQTSTASVRAIEAQPLPSALKSFAQATGLQLVYVSEIAQGLQSRGAEAGLSPQKSLQALLSGTGLTFEFVNDRTVSIKQGASAAADPARKQSYERQHAQLLQMALAQATPVRQAAAVEQATPQTSTPAGSDAPVEVTVTGSRIRTLNTEVTAIPVVTITKEELERRGVNRLADVRWAIPQLAGSIGFNDNLVNGGTSRAQQVSTSFNLRGLGGNSTLVLVNGRRVPHTGQEAPGGAGGREDFSVDGIPVSAIERIDILPQGAGAVYGAEAIAGVINIVLKENYTGLETRLTYDTPFDTDVGQKSVSLTMGHRAGKLSTFATLSFEDQNDLASRDRWFSATADTRRFGSTSTNFLFSVPGGSGTLSTNSSPANSAGTPLPGLDTHVVNIPTGSAGTTGANAGYTLGDQALYDSAQYSHSIDGARRGAATVNMGYAVNDNVELYAEGRWSTFQNNTVYGPLTMSVQLPVGYPGNPFSEPVYLRKVFYDQPRQETDSEQRNMGAALGVRGNFLNNWRYDVSASWARNIVIDDAIVGGLDFSRLSAAMASANQPILAYDSLNGSDPNAPGVIDALRPALDHRDTTDVFQYAATADGTLWSGWAGDIRLAVGAEFGKEDVKFWRSPGSPSYLLTEPFGRDSKAAFAELSVPLLSARQNLPLVHRVEVGAAVRAQDYSDTDAINIPTYRLLYQPVRWLTLRASRAEGFKPVRLYDLLAPTTTFTTNITTTSPYRDNLRGGEPLTPGPYEYSSGGNPALHPERSVSRNIGMVLDVPVAALEGLSLSVDYYKLDYTERSGGAGWQILFDYFPERVTRAAPEPGDPYGVGRIISWDATNINLSGVFTSGWDYRLSYHRTFNENEVMVTLGRTDSDPTYTRATPGAVPNANFGHQPVRTSGSIFWARNAMQAGVSVNHQTEYFISGLTIAPYPKYIEFNPQFSYNFGKDARFDESASQWWARWLADSKFSLTIINALDREPTLEQAAAGRIVMDPRLRRYIVSFSKTF